MHVARSSSLDSGEGNVGLETEACSAEHQIMLRSCSRVVTRAVCLENGIRGGSIDHASRIVGSISVLMKRVALLARGKQLVLHLLEGHIIGVTCIHSKEPRVILRCHGLNLVGL